MARDADEQQAKEEAEEMKAQGLWDWLGSCVGSACKWYTRYICVYMFLCITCI